MSLITACPACQTQFEVNDEQLQAYAGKVRCGECNHVFDARSSLIDSTEETEAIAADESVVSAEEPIPASESIGRAEPPAETFTPEITETSNTQYGAAEADISYAASAEVEHAGIDNSGVNSSEAYVTDTDSYSAPAVTLDSPTAKLDDPLTTHAAEEANQIQALNWNLGREEANTTAIPEFLRNVSLSEEWPKAAEKPKAPWMFPLLTGLLLVTILLQFVYFTRTSLAANYPFTKPLLQSACKLAHCAVALPKDITQLTIDDADIQEHREREGILVFSSILINHGAVPQTYPMIELTLTNMADEPVLRKILTPKEYLPATSKVAEGLAAQQEQPVKTSLGISEKAVTGFRVAIAY
ncbi:MAG TPA: DUF3426 domain-containing protein [Methylophilus sp.]|uniref:DUF3426 domain-containing protein n=1 Tax=Methylophilus sp. TaxID=29541 RepID=UPI002C4FC687|nr:DUF3426 domain-containing protein [Methylophilus sp.]HSH86040.1 DUF3426 domain-containing protein [Methylophilus sp.]